MNVYQNLKHTGFNLPMKAILRVVSFAVLLIMLLPTLSRAGKNTVANVVPDDVEFAVLKQLYDSLAGSGWTTKTNWPVTGAWPASATSTQFGTWYGVTVVNGDIEKITLIDNKLTGKLPTTMGNLKALKELVVYKNKITGRIPATLAALRNSLNVLQLSTNLMYGDMPLWMGTMTNLKTLELNVNQFTGPIPPSLGNLTALTSLLLSDNQFKSAIPTSLCKLINLQSLGLSTNLLYGCIPADIGNLTKLRRINLSENQLTGSIPASFGNIQVMDYLHLAKNKLSGAIPKELGLMKGLIELYLHENNLTGNLPGELGELPKLSYLYAYNNQLIGGVPENLRKLSTIQRFYIQNNRLEGSLPSNLFTLWTRIDLMDVSNNQLTGDFPSIVAGKDKLRSIIADRNAFRTLPLDILSLNVLTTLNIQNNDLTTLPNFTGRTTNGILTLSVQNNQLDFYSLETLKNVGLKIVTFAPQRPIHDVTFLTAAIGSHIVIPSRPLGTHVTTINWEKRLPNGTWQSVGSGVNQDGTNVTFKRNAYSASDEGIYRWRASNDFVTEAILESDPITVKTSVRFNLDNFAFQYKYDGRHRVTHKKMPGADWTYIVYDERNRPVMTQNGELRKRNGWNFTKYDAYNRPVMTGVYYHTALLDQAGMSSLISTTNLFESYTGAVTHHGYSNTVFAASTFPVDSFDIQTVTYYDNYDFSTGWGSAYDYKKGLLDDQPVGDYTYQQDSEYWKQVVGQVTGTKVKTSGGDPYWLHTINYYDKDYRVIQKIADNYKGGTERTTTIYNFADKELARKTEYTVNKLTWQNLATVKVGVDNLTKTSFSASWTAGASSAEFIPEGIDGWVETTVIGTTANRMVGLSAQDKDATVASIDYALYMRGRDLFIYVSGSNVYTVPGVNFVGDKLRIDRKDNYISFYRNGIKVYPATPTALRCTTKLMVDVSMYHRNGTVNYTHISAGQGTAQTVVRQFVYDHAARVAEIWHKTNTEPEVLLVKNEYNELGKLITRKLHSTDNGASFKQHEDFRYNIRNWLERVNQSSLIPERPGDPQDYFGINLMYNEVIPSLASTPQFNGNISAVIWNNGLGQGDVTQNGYRYAYDTLGRIKSAEYREKRSDWGLPEYLDEEDKTQTSDAFSETGYRYDLNGNLQNLTRKGKNGLAMDVLIYEYGSGSQQGNQLRRVADTGDKYQGFNDGNTVGNDYAYDLNGNMIVDGNKNVASIVYNQMNLPIKVVKNTGDYVRYIYDATGRKHSQQVFDVNDGLTKRIDYPGELFYQNDTLKFINHEEGRVVMTGTTPEYQYNLKDNLNNVRVTFTSKEEIDNSLATLEDAKAATEQGQFLNYDEAVTINEPLFDRTHRTEAGHDNVTFRSTRLLGGNTNSIYGLAKSFSVMPGDKITADVHVKYVDTNDPGVQEWLRTFLTTLATPAAPPGVLVDGGAAGSLGGGVFPFTDYLDRTDDIGDGPKAYLNYMIFDRDFNYVDGGYRRVTTLAREIGATEEGVGHEPLTFEEGDIKITQPGFVYIYISNENPTPVEVFFDDFNVTHTKSPVVQTDDYYPYGLTFNRVQREDAVENRFLFNGKEVQNELGLGWFDYGARMYMPELGRWGAIDPLAEKYMPVSPYSYALDNPVMFVDHDGRDVIPTISVNYLQVTTKLSSVHDLGATYIRNIVPVASQNGNYNVKVDIVISMSNHFADGPGNRNNADAPLNKENPGLHGQVMAHEQGHASQLKQVIQQGGYSYKVDGKEVTGKLDAVATAFMKSFDKDVAAAEQKVYTSKADLQKTQAKLEGKMMDFKNSMNNQINQKMKATFTEGTDPIEDDANRRAGASLYQNGLKSDYLTGQTPIQQNGKVVPPQAPKSSSEK
jgi:RHS repeat-associated protein